MVIIVGEIVNKGLFFNVSFLTRNEFARWIRPNVYLIGIAREIHFTEFVWRPAQLRIVDSDADSLLITWCHGAGL